jgi:hypothetical protein
LDRAAVERRAGANQEVLLEVAVPERMVVSRDARPGTLTEVFATVRMALKHDGVPVADTLQLGDILFESQVFVSQGDPGLQVMRMEFDRGLRRARFLLWPSHDPNVVPFFVTALLGGDLPTTQVQPAKEFDPLAKDAPVAAAPIGVAKQEIKKQILVAQGEQATLVLHSDALRIFVDVVSLERGTLGRQIQSLHPAIDLLQRTCASTGSVARL